MSNNRVASFARVKYYYIYYNILFYFGTGRLTSLVDDQPHYNVMSYIIIVIIIIFNIIIILYYSCVDWLIEFIRGVEHFTFRVYIISHQCIRHRRNINNHRCL